MAQLTDLGRALAHLRSILGFSLDAWATRVGGTAEALDAIEHGDIRLETLDEIARLCALDEGELREGILVPVEGSTVFLLHSAYMDFDAQDLGVLDRAMRAARLMTASSAVIDHGASLRRRLAFVPVQPVGPRPADAAQQGHRLARQVREKLGLGGDPIPDMRALLEEQLGVAVLVDELSSTDLRAAAIRDRHRASAATVLAANDHRRDKNPILARVYLAHELCHLLFDPAPPNSVRLVLDDNPDGRPRSTGLSSVALLESRANGFAAEFLVPLSGLIALLGQPGDTPLSLDEARDMVARVREVFSTPWPLTTHHLGNLGYIQREFKFDLLSHKPKPTTPRHSTSLPRAGQMPDRLKELVTRLPSPKGDGLVHVEAARLAARMAIVGRTSEVIHRVEAAVNDGRALDAVDMLVECFDDLFTAGEFEVACDTLVQLDPRRLPPKVLTGVLMVSAHARDELGATREEFFARVMVALAETWQLDTDQLRAVERRLR
jgi:Zn-dependent peptidase ImmA (M78 family)